MTAREDQQRRDDERRKLLVREGAHLTEQLTALRDANLELSEQLSASHEKAAGLKGLVIINEDTEASLRDQLAAVTAERDEAMRMFDEAARNFDAAHENFTAMFDQRDALRAENVQMREENLALASAPDPRDAEIERLRELVKSAHAEGYDGGWTDRGTDPKTRRHDHRRDWSTSEARAALADQAPRIVWKYICENPQCACADQAPDEPPAPRVCPRCLHEYNARHRPLSDPRVRRLVQMLEAIPVWVEWLDTHPHPVWDINQHSALRLFMRDAAEALAALTDTPDQETKP